MSGWRLALRLARRLVRRHLGRSILIAALVAVPVAGATVVDGLIRTAVDPDTDRYWEMGTADARVSAGESVDLAALLPAGSRAVVAGTDQFVQVRLAAGDRLVRTYLLVAEPGDELTEHVVRLSSGRVPRGAGEVLMSESLADRLGLLAGGRLRPAATATMVDGPAVRVTGLAITPGCMECETVVAAPGSTLAGTAAAGRVRYAVDLPAGTDVDALGHTLAGQRVDFAFRETYVGSGTFLEFLDGASGSIALLAGLGLLEVVLLAGAAFAVGARRQVRELGLIAANGGTAKHLRRVMLAQGLVLGVLGAGSGVLLGAIATVLGMPLWQQVSFELVTDLRFGWVELTVVAAVGVLACVVAALVPAIGAARMRPVDALARRFRTTTTAARLPLLGVLLLLAGGTWVVVEGVLGRRRLADRAAGLYSASDPPVAGILAGAALMVLGLILVAPALVAAAGRLGRRLPLSGRLAVRDAGRHRYRTVAAIAAVMIAVAGSVATAFVFGAQADDDQKTLPANTVHLEPDTVEGTGDGSRHQLDWATAHLTATLPDAAVHELVSFDANNTKEMSPIALWPPDNGAQCPAVTLGAGTPETIELSTGRVPDAGQRSALAGGKVVVFDDCLLSPTGTVRLIMSAEGAPTELPAYVAERAAGTEDYYWLPGAFISTQAAAARGWTPTVASTVVTYSATADQDEVNAQFDVVAAAGLNVVVDEDESARLDTLFLLLAGGSALVTLLGVGVTVALSAAEGRADLATLAALGAQPRRRRALAGAHALVIGGLGTLLGLLLGGCIGYAAIPMAYLSGFAVPWLHVGLTAVGVPCLAVAVAMLATRSRLPMIQRQGS